MFRGATRLLKTRNAVLLSFNSNELYKILLDNSNGTFFRTIILDLITFKTR